ncbi:hypothetical protein [Aggregatibacter actinomycetemcomitans]|uniref:hypothetical protein n=1 Tax=Aggregatibacter actinomycetemcomitans TaxID=714 RepID=UPI00197B651F|nr:hypothetical protein [Aggregatibacter actinomycetemcomitans]
MRCMKFIFKLYLLLFTISTIYAIFTLDDLYHKVTKHKDTEDVISRIILNDDSVYFIGKLANYEFKREKNTGFNALPFTLSDHIIYVYFANTTIRKNINDSISSDSIHLIINPKKLNKEQIALLDKRITMDTSQKFMLEGEILQAVKRQDPTWSDRDEAYLIKYISLIDGRILLPDEKLIIRTSLETQQTLRFTEEYEVEEFNQNAIDDFLEKVTAPVWIPMMVVIFPLALQGIPHG